MFNLSESTTCHHTFHRSLKIFDFIIKFNYYVTELTVSDCQLILLVAFGYFLRVHLWLIELF